MHALTSHTLRLRCHIPLQASSSRTANNRQGRPSASINNNAVNPFADQFSVNLRRSADYHPTVWEPKLIQSLTTDFSYELHGKRLDKLKKEVGTMLKCTKDVSILLKLIDSIQRSGVAYHFNEEIESAFNHVLSCVDDGWSLSTTALRFRLLRQHGHFVSKSVFDKFKDETGNFLECLSNDIEGLVNLYESTFLGTCGEEEEDIEKLRDFSIKHLQLYLDYHPDIGFMRNIVKDGLSDPLHWRSPRLEARNFMELHRTDINSVLLELASLDYNLVQSIHQEEVKELTKWWNELGFREKLRFSRDRLMENFLWVMGVMFEPHYSKMRITLTKFVCILSAIDDMFDIYGSLDELESFMIAVERWDLKAMDDLPLYMKICYHAMYNFGNEVAYDILRDHGTVRIEFVKEEWKRLCRSYLTESRWFYDGYEPLPEEYMENALISVGGHGAIVHLCLLLGLYPLNESCLDGFSGGSGPIYWSCLITRLSNDMGTSKDEIARGDVPKSIQSYMLHKRVSEKEARNIINCQMNDSWKKLNETIINKSFDTTVTTLSLNMSRIALSIYQHGDGIGTSFGSTKEKLASLLGDPIIIY